MIIRIKYYCNNNNIIIIVFIAFWIDSSQRIDHGLIGKFR